MPRGTKAARKAEEGAVASPAETGGEAAAAGPASPVRKGAIAKSLAPASAPAGGSAGAPTTMLPPEEAPTPLVDSVSKLATTIEAAMEGIPPSQVRWVAGAAAPRACRLTTSSFRP